MNIKKILFGLILLILWVPVFNFILSIFGADFLPTFTYSGELYFLMAFGGAIISMYNKRLNVVDYLPKWISYLPYSGLFKAGLGWVTWILMGPFFAFREIKHGLESRQETLEEIFDNTDVEFLGVLDSEGNFTEASSKNNNESTVRRK